MFTANVVFACGIQESANKKYATQNINFHKNHFLSPFLKYIRLVRFFNFGAKFKLIPETTKFYDNFFLGKMKIEVELGKAYL